jgi:hypothetical protein
MPPEEALRLAAIWASISKKIFYLKTATGIPHVEDPDLAEQLRSEPEAVIMVFTTLEAASKYVEHLRDNVGVDILLEPTESTLEYIFNELKDLGSIIEAVHGTKLRLDVAHMDEHGILIDTLTGLEEDLH